MTEPAWMSAVPGLRVLLAVLGLCLGSFLNVVIHRIPRDESLVRPGSRCPGCGRFIAPRDNVPLLSYLLLRGRCRGCGAHISIRYPLVELAGAACLLAAAQMSGSPAGAAVRAIFLLAFVAAALIDLEHRIIPDEITLGGIALGLLAAPLLDHSRLDALIGMIAGSAGLLAIALAYRWLRGVEGMGLGDVKLAGMIGAFLGWRGLFVAILVGSFTGSVTGIVLMLTGRATAKTALPFGVFLSLGALLASQFLAVTALSKLIW